MGSVSTKEEMENEAIDETSNSVTANIDTDSSFESIDEITIETEEKHESLKEEVNEQNSQEESINDMNKQETNNEVSKLTNEFKNAHIQEQTPILNPKVQGSLQKSKYHRCFMVTSSTNKDTGVTKSIFDAQHANNDKTPPGKSGTPICNLSGCACTCIHRLGSSSFCTCPCCTSQANRANTQFPLENQFHQPGSSQTVTQSYVQPPPQNNYQTHGHHAFISSIDPGPLTAPLPTVQAFQQQHFPPMEQHNQYLIGTCPRSGYGTIQPNVNWNTAPNHSQMQATAYYPQRPTLVPAPQQHHFLQMEQHNQGWSGTGPGAGYGTGPEQQNMNWIPGQIHNQMQATVTTSNITNHSAPYNHPSTSASQVSHTGRKGRPRLSDDKCDTKSLKAREYNKKQRDLIKLGAKINENLDSFCEEDRALIERLKAEIDNANGNQEPDPKHE